MQLPRAGAAAVRCRASSAVAGNAGTHARSVSSMACGLRHGLARTHGFTLIEILLVLSLMAIAITAVSVSIARSLGGAEIRAAGRDMVAALRYTRGQAIVTRTEQAFVVDVANMSYTAPGRAEVELPEAFEVRMVTAAREQLGEGKGAIRFFPDGSSGGGVIRLLREKREWQVEIAWLTGEIRLREIKT